MHVHGHGKTAELAKSVKPAPDLIGHVTGTHTSSAATGNSRISGGQIDTAKIASIGGHEGEQTGPVYRITIGRDGLDLKEMGAKISARMGLNTWAAFFGSDSKAEIAGDVAMLDREVGQVLRALRQNGLNTEPAVYFLHYWGTGPAEKLATGFKAALDQLGKGGAKSAQGPPANAELGVLLRELIALLTGSRRIGLP